MKLSEAIVLGSTMIKLDPGIFLADGCGCLIGMGMAANGFSSVHETTLKSLWPWMTNAHIGWISTWACHVKSGTMSFDEVLDKIRALEPSEVIEPVPVETEELVAQ